MDWQAFFSAFALIFVAELGDKTQLAVMAQVCKFRCPWSVFLGSSLALTLVTALGAVGGRVLGYIVPASIIRIVAAAGFVGMGLLIAWEAYKAPRKDCDDASPTTTLSTSGRWNWEAFASALGLLFLAELGDKTQLAVLGLASKTSAPWLVFLGSSLALIAVTALGVLGGKKLCQLIPAHILLQVSAFVFVAMGVLMGMGIL